MYLSSSCLFVVLLIRLVILNCIMYLMWMRVSHVALIDTGQCTYMYINQESKPVIYTIETKLPDRSADKYSGALFHDEISLAPRQSNWQY